MAKEQEKQCGLYTGPYAFYRLLGMSGEEAEQLIGAVKTSIREDWSMGRIIDEARRIAEGQSRDEKTS